MTAAKLLGPRGAAGSLKTLEIGRENLVGCMIGTALVDHRPKRIDLAVGTEHLLVVPVENELCALCADCGYCALTSYCSCGSSKRWNSISRGKRRKPS